jgi:hypothetical protein
MTTDPTMDWDKTIEKAKALWPAWKAVLNDEQARVWLDSIGPGTRCGNQVWVRQAMDRVFAHFASETPKLKWIIEAFEQIRSENSEAKQQRRQMTPERQDLRNERPITGYRGRPPLHLCETVLKIRQTSVQRQRLDRLAAHGVSTPEALQAVFGQNDEWGWTYLEIPEHALRVLERADRPADHPEPRNLSDAMEAIGATE